MENLETQKKTPAISVIRICMVGMIIIAGFRYGGRYWYGAGIAAYVMFCWLIPLEVAQKRRTSVIIAVHIAMGLFCWCFWNEIVEVVKTPTGKALMHQPNSKEKPKDE